MAEKPDFSTADKCRAYISSIELDGERVGYLVNAKTGEETPLWEADEVTLRNAAEMIYKMIDRQAGVTTH